MTDKEIKQLFMIINQLDMTQRALNDLLIEKGIITAGELLKTYQFLHEQDHGKSRKSIYTD